MEGKKASGKKNFKVLNTRSLSGGTVASEQSGSVIKRGVQTSKYMQTAADIGATLD